MFSNVENFDMKSKRKFMHIFYEEDDASTWQNKTVHFVNKVQVGRRPSFDAIHFVLIF